MFVYTVQPVVSRFDNRLYRVNGALVIVSDAQLHFIMSVSAGQYSKLATYGKPLTRTVETAVA